ncbi:MAG TPA: TetR/AcrR family transcriptional regulator [Reyranella sp.]|jgi:AcrR family transcriptional regulator|nr:TetR/AcrR family transcriptional regulator [Reyranella sp.]
MDSTSLAVPSTRWRRRKDARPGEIVAASLACFAERGFAATRLEDVARRAGVTKGTLYLYFPNKEELFKAVVRQAVVPNIALGEALVDQSAEPAPVVLQQLVARLSVAMVAPASAIPKIVVAEAGNFPDIARFYLEEVIQRGLAMFRRLLELGVARGEFRPMDVESTAYCIVAPMVLGMMWRHSFERHEEHPFDAAALCRAHLQVLSRGLVPLGKGDRAAGVRPRRRRKGADR